MASNDEREPLLPNTATDAGPPQGAVAPDNGHQKTKTAIGTGLVFIFILALVLLSVFVRGRLPSDPDKAAVAILSKAPDGHIDLPILVRSLYANNVSRLDMRATLPGQVDIKRLKEGKVGAFFWSVYTPCEDSGADFINPTNSVRDTLEQIDVSQQIMDKYSDVFVQARGVDHVRAAIRDGRIAGLLGVEGAHQLGNSLGVLRTYAELGVKYITLTHICHNVFADSVGFGQYLPPLHGGISDMGRALIDEMNRLGILVDLSHTSDETARQGLQYSKAPVIWSHSSARAVWDHPRNVPDDVLQLIGDTEGKKDAVVMVNFAPAFVGAPGNATVEGVADHVEHIARVAGVQHVGLGSDFDGIPDVPKGLKDVSEYPKLIAELIRRGWAERELAGLAGGNLLRVLEKAEVIAARLAYAGTGARYDVYKKRLDL